MGSGNGALASDGFLIAVAVVSFILLVLEARALRRLARDSKRRRAELLSVAAAVASVGNLALVGVFTYVLPGLVTYADAWHHALASCGARGAPCDPYVIPSQAVYTFSFLIIPATLWMFAGWIVLVRGLVELWGDVSM